MIASVETDRKHGGREGCDMQQRSPARSQTVDVAVMATGTPQIVPSYCPTANIQKEEALSGSKYWKAHLSRLQLWPCAINGYFSDWSLIYIIHISVSLTSPDQIADKTNKTHSFSTAPADLPSSQAMSVYSDSIVPDLWPYANFILYAPNLEQKWPKDKPQSGLMLIFNSFLVYTAAKIAWYKSQLCSA